MLDSVGEDLEEELEDNEIVSVHSSNSGGRGGGEGGLPPFCPPPTPPLPEPPRPSPDNDWQCFNMESFLQFVFLNYLKSEKKTLINLIEIIS